MGDVPLSEPSVIVAVSAPAPRRGVRGRARDHRPRQGGGADLEEGDRGRRRALGGGDARRAERAPASEPSRRSRSSARVMSRCSSQSRIAPSMNHSQARAAARSRGGGGSPAPMPSRIRAEVASRMPSTSALHLRHAAGALHQPAVGDLVLLDPPEDSPRGCRRAPRTEAGRGRARSGARSPRRPAGVSRRRSPACSGSSGRAAPSRCPPRARSSPSRGRRTSGLANRSRALARAAAAAARRRGAGCRRVRPSGRSLSCC